MDGVIGATAFLGLHRQRLSVLELLGTVTSARALLCDNADERPTNKHVLASLVCVASGFHLRPSRTSTTGLAPRCGTEMDRRHHQRFGTTLGLSEGSGVTPLLVF